MRNSHHMANYRKTWKVGSADVTVIVITLNEGHNLRKVLDNLAGWAGEVFVVDSYSQDETIDIALSYGVSVVQRKFRGFGDQWNFALQRLPIRTAWTMKIDPDERLTDELKRSVERELNRNDAAGYSVDRQLWFVGKPLPITQRIVRLWKTGSCVFSQVAVNEHPIITGSVKHLSGILEHHDSPCLDHWFEKQNRYTTSEAIIAATNAPLADKTKLFGTHLQRRMWMKRYYRLIPFRHYLTFLHCLLIQGSIRAGWAGYVWARLRSDVYRWIEFKTREMQRNGLFQGNRVYGPGSPDPRVMQFD